MNHFNFFIFFIVFFASVSVAWASPRSLCSSEEEIVFTCSIGKKTASVCSSRDLSRTSGYVQYRFGASARALDLIYPQEKVGPITRFSYGYDGSAKSSLRNLHFFSSGYSYNIYVQSAAFDENGAGIIVRSLSGKATRLKCKEEMPPAEFDKIRKLGLRTLPWESLASLDSFGAWPAESPNADLLQGVRTHNFTLVKWALAHGADVNFHGEYDAGVLAALADLRANAVSLKRTAEFDNETDQLVTFLLAHGASPRISMINGNTAIDSLANKVPLRTVVTLLNAGWPSDYHYRLYVGALLGNPTLSSESLAHGADPNKPIRGDRILRAAIRRACDFSYEGEDKENRKPFITIELLLKAGARVDEGNPGKERGDILRTYADCGNKPDYKPMLDLLVRYASAAVKKNSLDELRIFRRGASLEQQANIDWLIKRLSQ